MNNRTGLEKMGEQLMQAYDYGVRMLWVVNVNVGDIKPDEVGINYW
jgi:hypothetical protein